MSVYSGFSTRAQESKYGQLCEMLISLLSNKLLRNFKGEKTDNSQFFKGLTAIYMKMVKLESIKYLPPKFSSSINDLLDFCSSSFSSSTCSSSALTDSEIVTSSKMQNTFSPLSARPLEQINEEKAKPSKKKFIFAQEKSSKPPQFNPENNETIASSYYEKVMEKYIKLSNKYAPRTERSLSVGNRDTDLFYKDGNFFKS